VNVSRLGLDKAVVNRARQAARVIADNVATVVEPRTTVAIERTVLRLIGVDGVREKDDTPLPNVVVDKVARTGGLEGGVFRSIAAAMLTSGKSAQDVAEGIAQHDISLDDTSDEEAVRRLGEELGRKAASDIAARRAKRDELLTRHGCGPEPLHYVIVASGNIYEDVNAARVAARQGADIIAVIRSTGQSLIDYVPYGPTTEGYGGTYATQANFRIMREALDDVGEELGRYIRLCNYCSGLCMPEIAAMGALERLDVMLNDALYGILFRDINMVRTLCDQKFSRRINGRAGIIINTGEDNYLTTADAVEAAHTVVGSQFINEQLALDAGLETHQLGLGHAFEIDPSLEDGFLLELAQALLVRELFPGCPIKYMPPTKHMTGNIFRGHIQDALFNLVGVWTQQGIQLLGMMTEAMHTPHIHDRYLSLENARYVMNNARHLGDEIQFKSGGLIQTRAQTVLAEAADLLESVADEGLLSALSRGVFADVRRTKDGGRGLDGVVMQGSDYFNPVEEALK
jgi:beta-lysine 5,6-aminomutase alpha subunit